ncbi:MAG: hypothetical protein KDC98_11485 [Planctomycetes bacterium]|nr:hypothetical protein [Planctomycetota bacterium]
MLKLEQPTLDRFGDDTSRAGFWSVAWTPDDHAVVTGSSDGSVHFWRGEPRAVQRR